MSYLRNYWAIDMSVGALCSAGSAAPTTLLFLQFARIRFQTFCHISETIGPIDLSVNALCSAGSAAPITLLFLQFARISVLNILSYLRNYWANRPECQSVVLSRLDWADFTVVSSICKNKVLNILSYLRNYWANRPELTTRCAQQVALHRLHCCFFNLQE